MLQTVVRMVEATNKLPLLMILSGISLVLAGCGDDRLEARSVISHKTWDLPVVEVRIKELPKYYRTSGSVISDQRIDIASRTTGFIREILVREGDRVTKGQDLIKLDNSDVEGAIRQAQAAVEKATSALKDAEADVIQHEALVKSGSIPQITLRKTHLQHDLARDSLDEMRAVLATALSQRKYTRISSPLAGVVVSRHKREGDLAVTGSPLLTVEFDQGLLLDTYVAESRVGKINQADIVRVTVDALDEPLTSMVSRIVPSGDPMTRRYQVKLALPDGKGLLPGMFGRAHFYLGTETSTMIPVDALIERGGLRGVFVVDGESTIHFRWLNTGKVVGEHIIARAGIDPGEHIVALADARLRDGDRIRQDGPINE